MTGRGTRVAAFIAVKYKTHMSLTTRPTYSFVAVSVSTRLLRFPRAERGRVHNAAVAWHRLSAEERAGLHLVGHGVLAIHDVFWRSAVASFIFALEDQVVHGPRHDRAERP